eukprot:TRINITY_DN36423_c2_g1_i3.p1 TRINITY_DN36423_c2_g1~~TRINITY_DN36423_c2_g1_i3.p1  ORF type:complete len:701 (+),score=149.64 TRINITY_DN36423_c2_g1_i3:179-2104(+)
MGSPTAAPAASAAPASPGNATPAGAPSAPPSASPQQTGGGSVNSTPSAAPSAAPAGAAVNASPTAAPTQSPAAGGGPPPSAAPSQGGGAVPTAAPAAANATLVPGSSPTAAPAAANATAAPAANATAAPAAQLSPTASPSAEQSAPAPTPRPSQAGNESGCALCGTAPGRLAEAASQCTPMPGCAACTATGEQQLLPNCTHIPRISILSGASVACFGGCRGASFSCSGGGCTVRCLSERACQGLSLACPAQLSAAHVRCLLSCAAASACSGVGPADITGAATVECSPDLADSCSPALLRMAAAAGDSEDLPSWVAAVAGSGGALCCVLIAFLWWYTRAGGERAKQKEAEKEAERAAQRSQRSLGGDVLPLVQPAAVLPPTAPQTDQQDAPTEEGTERHSRRRRPRIAKAAAPAPPGPALPAVGAAVTVPSDAVVVHTAIQDHPSLSWHEGYLRGLGAEGEVVSADASDGTVLVRFYDPPAEAWYPGELIQDPQADPPAASLVPPDPGTPRLHRPVYAVPGRQRPTPWPSVGRGTSLQPSDPTAAASGAPFPTQRAQTDSSVLPARWVLKDAPPPAMAVPDGLGHMSPASRADRSGDYVPLGDGGAVFGSGSAFAPQVGGAREAPFRIAYAPIGTSKPRLVV